jgi:hypothetical protein
MVVDGKVVYETHDNANMASSAKVGVLFFLFFFFFFFYYLLNE